MKNLKTYLILTISIIYCLIGCSNNLSLSKTTEFVWNYAQKHPEGFTINIETQQPIIKGIAVSYLITQNSFGKESLPKIINHALNHDLIVGGWFNIKDSLYYFDSNKIFHDTLLTDAIKFAELNKQQAIFDITNDSTIWISSGNVISD